MNEFELIARLRPGLAVNSSVRTGAGDDCAVLDLGLSGEFALLKADAVVEGIHFLPDTPARQVGHKALARALSDIAAMGGKPGSAVVTLGLPRPFDPARVEGVYEGLNATARRHGVAVVGGETTTNPERLFLSVALLGTVEKDRCVLRSGAKAGDALFVTGELGGSLAGRHLSFEPRLAEARWLTEHHRIHSMIDLSDGLAGDLRHVLEASHVGAELRAESIPISRAARQRARSNADAPAPLQAALSDGEDFELLFSVPARQAVALTDAWRAAFPKVRLSCIGRITTEPGLRLIDPHGSKPLAAHGYVHFQ